MHLSGFAKTRDFLLDHSAAIIQDDSGIPVGDFEPGKWQLHPFGRYLGPISIFQQHYQPKLAALFRLGRSEPIDFGIGYRWHARESNLLLAVKSASKSAQAP
jgi:hypothetical protein